MPKKINSNSNSNTKKKQMSLNKVKFDLKNKKLTKKKITKKDNISSAYQRTKSYNEEQISKKKSNKFQFYFPIKLLLFALAKK